MKYTLFMLFLLMPVLVFSQDNKDPQPIINLNDAVLSNTNNKFVKSWNWASIDRRLDSAMDMNFYHRNTEPSPNPYDFMNNQWRIQANSNLGGGDKTFAASSSCY